MHKATVALDPADLRALRKATGKADASAAIAALVNRLTPKDGATAKPAKKRATKKPARPQAKKAKPAKKAKGSKKPLSKAAFLSRMAAGRAKAAKTKKKGKK